MRFRARCCSTAWPSSSARASRAVDGARITTIEGAAQNGALHPLQDPSEQARAAVRFLHAGMILASHELLRRTPIPPEEQIRYGLAGNMCDAPAIKKTLSVRSAMPRP